MVGDATDRRVEILCERDELHVTWTRFAPGRDGAPPHVHRRHTDVFYVLAGELTVLTGVEARASAVPAGTLVVVPPLVVHGFRNVGDTELRYLNVHAPGSGFADYLRGRNPAFDQEEPPTDGGRPTTEIVIVPAGTTGVLVERDELSVEIVGEGGTASRSTCVYALGDGRSLHLHA